MRGRGQNLNLVHAGLDGCGPSDVVPAAPAKQIVFLVLFVYTVTKKVTGLAENDASGPEQVIHFWC